MCFSLMGEVAESKARAVAASMGLAKADVLLDTVDIKKRKDWNGSSFEDNQIEQGVDEGELAGKSEENGDNGTVEKISDLPGQVIEEDYLSIFDEVTSDNEEDEGSLFGHHPASEDEE